MYRYKTKKHNYYGISVLLFLSSMVICLLLFYADEAVYSLKGLSDPNNLVAIPLYMIGIFTGQNLLFYLCRKQFSTAGSLILACIVGSLAGIVITIGVIFPLAGLLNACGIL